MNAELTCAEVVELVTGYLEGALDRATERRFEAHLPLCDGCDRYLDQVRRTVELIARSGADATLPDEARARLLAAFRDRSK